jgi:hypothetical protein
VHTGQITISGRFPGNQAQLVFFILGMRMGVFWVHGQFVFRD